MCLWVRCACVWVCACAGWCDRLLLVFIPFAHAAYRGRRSFWGGGGRGPRVVPAGGGRRGRGWAQGGKFAGRAIAGRLSGRQSVGEHSTTALLKHLFLHREGKEDWNVRKSDHLRKLNVTGRALWRRCGEADTPELHRLITPPLQRRHRLGPTTLDLLSHQSTSDRE